MRSFGIVVLAAMMVHATTATSYAVTPWSWARSSIRYVDNQNLLQQSVADAPASKRVSRSVYVRSLASLENWRADHYGTPKQLPGATGATLSDVSSESVYARAVKLGWIKPIGGAFKGSKPITANEASRGIIGAMGLRSSARKFSRRLRQEIPGLGTDTYLRAVHVYARSLDTRYNHLQGYEKYEVGPTEPMRVAHVAFMLHHAAKAESWRVQSLRQYEQFDIPTLKQNQKTVLRTTVRMIGQPYVWAGESENMQPEGHGGFDCSGFVWRTVLNSGVPAPQRYVINDRTSMGMSNIRKRKRIYRQKRLKPGDLLFWGNRGPKSKPAENYHAGVYMGNGWFVHSSGGNAGATIQRLDGYWKAQFSWGRRALKRY